MAHTCRGTIPLATAHIEVGETCHLVLTSGGRSYHLKATSEGECQRWVSALQKAKSSATLLMHHSGEVNILTFPRAFSDASGSRGCFTHPPTEVWRNSLVTGGGAVKLDSLCILEGQYRPPGKASNFRWSLRAASASKTHLPKCIILCSSLCSGVEAYRNGNSGPQEGSVDCEVRSIFFYPEPVSDACH